MRYRWRAYTADDTAVVDGWMDDDARYYTGCDDGWGAYVSYMRREPYIRPGENFFCMLIYDREVPIAAAALYRTDDGMLCISELVVCPAHRGQGHGTALLRELIACAKDILGCEIRGATAVIYPDNKASIRAFTGAGFTMTHAHPDGDALYYTCESVLP